MVHRVECSIQKDDDRLFKKIVLMEITGEWFKDSAFKCFRQEREERDRPVVYNIRRVESGFL